MNFDLSEEHKAVQEAAKVLQRMNASQELLREIETK